jgi:hypothetical protein
MTKILTDVYSVIRLKEQEARGELTAWPTISQDTCALIQNLVICDRILLDRDISADYHVAEFSQRFDEVFEFVDTGGLLSDRSKLDLVKTQMGSKLGASADDPFLSAALIYVAAAQSLGVFLLLYPPRSDFLKLLSLEPKGSAATMALQELERRIVDTGLAKYAGIDLAVPPVAEYVFNHYHQSGVDLASAINEIRNSKNARLFRRYCSAVDAELAHLSPRASLATLQRLLGDVRRAADKWLGNFNEGVHYVTRQISLRKVWGIGPLLEAIGAAPIQFRDPVLWSPENASLLFLNDLYRSPRN